MSSGIPVRERRTFGEEWAEYAAKVLPADAPDVQRVETRRAFYGGAWVLFNLIQLNLDAGSEPTAEDLAYMDTLVEEFRRFRETVGSDAEVRAAAAPPNASPASAEKHLLQLPLDQRDAVLLSSMMSLGCALVSATQNMSAKNLEPAERAAVKMNAVLQYVLEGFARGEFDWERQRSINRRFARLCQVAFPGVPIEWGGDRKPDEGLRPGEKPE